MIFFMFFFFNQCGVSMMFVVLFLFCLVFACFVCFCKCQKNDKIKKKTIKNIFKTSLRPSIVHKHYENNMFFHEQTAFEKQTS